MISSPTVYRHKRKFGRSSWSSIFIRSWSLCLLSRIWSLPRAMPSSATSANVSNTTAPIATWWQPRRPWQKSKRPPRQQAMTQLPLVRRAPRKKKRLSECSFGTASSRKSSKTSQPNWSPSVTTSRRNARTLSASCSTSTCCWRLSWPSSCRQLGRTRSVLLNRLRWSKSPSLCMPCRTSACLPVCLSVYLWVWLSVCVSLFLSVCMSVCLFIPIYDTYVQYTLLLYIYL